MNLNEINFLLVIIWFLFVMFVCGFENSFKSIIVSEFLWISLFCIYLLLSLIYDDINFLTMTLFFLIFSAIEISICLILIIIQKKLFKTLNLSFSTNNWVFTKKFNFTNNKKFKN